MKKIVLLSSLLAVCAISLQAEVFRAQQYEQKRYIYEDRIKIRSNKLGNWYVLGDMVTFSSAHKFAPNDKIRVVLTDHEGSVFLDKTLSGKEFNEKAGTGKAMSRVTMKSSSTATANSSPKGGTSRFGR